MALSTTSQDAAVPDVQSAARLVVQALALFWRSILTHFHLPYDIAMRVYLAANVLIYGGRGIAVLFFSPHLLVNHSAAAWVSGAMAQILWGVTELIVALGNAICIPRRSLLLWQITAVITAMWATAWTCTITMLALFYNGDYSGPPVWGFIVIVHLLMIRNRFVSVDEEEAIIRRYHTTLASILPYVTQDMMMAWSDGEPNGYDSLSPDHGTSNGQRGDTHGNHHRATA